MDAMPQKLSLHEQMVTTHTTLNVACASLDLFWVYAGKKNEKHLPESMYDNYHQFIIFDREAHFRNAIVTLLTLFDKRSDAITLKALIDGAQLKKVEERELLALLEKLRPRVEKIKVIRHNLFAHRKNAGNHNAIFQQAQLTRNDLEVTLRMAIRVFNRVAKAIDAPRYQRNRWARDQLFELIKAATDEEA
jgi:hypothetical protein